MASLYEAAVAASIVMGLVSIPAASQTVETGETFNTDINSISGSGSPGQVSTAVGPHGFTSRIMTAFSSFTSNVSQGAVSTSLEEPGSRLVVEKNPGSTTWRLTTSRGELTVSGSSSRVVQQLETPEGTLRIVRDNGREERSFTGINRDGVEQTFNDLMEEMRDKKDVIDKKRKVLEKSEAPDVDVLANESTASGFGDNTLEHVVIVNSGLGLVEIDNWILEDDSGSSHELNGALEQGERLHVYTEDRDEVDNCPSRCVYGSGISWNNDGDTAVLKDASGSVVSETSY